MLGTRVLLCKKSKSYRLTWRFLASPLVYPIWWSAKSLTFALWPAVQVQPKRDILGLFLAAPWQRRWPDEGHGSSLQWHCCCWFLLLDSTVCLIRRDGEEQSCVYHSFAFSFQRWRNSPQHGRLPLLFGGQKIIFLSLHFLSVSSFLLALSFCLSLTVYLDESEKLLA